MRNEQQAYIKTHNVHFFIGFETLHDETASMQLKQSRTEVAILAMSGLVIVSVYLQKKKKSLFVLRLRSKATDAVQWSQWQCTTLGVSVAQTFLTANKKKKKNDGLIQAKQPIKVVKKKKRKAVVQSKEKLRKMRGRRQKSITTQLFVYSMESGDTSFFSLMDRWQHHDTRNLLSHYARSRVTRRDAS